MPIFKVLTIAGSDSSGGAGIQADLKTFAAMGVYGCSVITAVTAQNTCQVADIHPVPADIVAKQLESVMTDIRPDALKSGMLVNAEIIRAVAVSLKRFPKVPFVLDPVMVAKSGDALLEVEAVESLRECLFPLADVVTPNIPEAEVLLGRRLETETDLHEAAKSIHGMGAQVVVLKGGHRPRPTANSTAHEVEDLFYDGRDIIPIRGPFVVTPHTHGTGCTFASAIAAGLAKKMAPYAAVLQAREYLTGALLSAYAVGNGKSPVHHFHRWWS